MTSDIVCLDSVTGKLTFYSGGTTPIHSIDSTQFLLSAASISVGVRAISLSESNESNFQLHFSDGSQKRVTMQYEISDFVVISIIKILRKTLPESLYAGIVQDTAALFCNVKDQQQKDQQD